MKVAIFGATGSIGSRIVAEARSRGIEVTAVVRSAERAATLPAGVEWVVADVGDVAGVAAAVAGQDAVISAVGGGDADSGPAAPAAARTLPAALAQAGVFRLLVVGGAGSLRNADGVELVETPSFPAAWKPASLPQREALAIYRAYTGPVRWTYLSPADVIEPGERTGRFTLGGDEVVVDAAGESRISIEDYAVALVDELEKGEFVNRRFTLAYT
ncbi:MAG: NAD(P)H-binding protein [Solirubrobacterales bacterium]